MSLLRLILAGIGLAALIGAFFYGQHVGRTACEAAHLAADRKTADAREAVAAGAQAADAQAAARDGARQSIMREIIREVPTYIDRPVYRNVCIDADGVRALERSVSAANGGGAAERGAAGRAGAVQPAAEPAGRDGSTGN